MGEFRWLPSMSVGVHEFDEDHRRCVALLGEIGTAIHDGRLADAKESCLALVRLVEDHVCREESFLQRLGFPNTATVIDAQKDSLRRVIAISETISDSPEDAAAIILGMQSAVIDYLLRADINFKSFVQAAGSADTEPG